jgi:hypothetical protein
MESEVDLNDILQEMHVIATVPDLYHILVELNAVQSLLQLLSHDNTDISIAVVDLLQELTDVDALTESDDAADILIDALVRSSLGLRYTFVTKIRMQKYIGNFTTLLKPHNIDTHLKGIETSFQVVPLFLKSFHFGMSYITFLNFLKIPSVFKGLKFSNSGA